jgi:hypothetical protein
MKMTRTTTDEKLTNAEMADTMEAVEFGLEEIMDNTMEIIEGIDDAHFKGYYVLKSGEAFKRIQDDALQILLAARRLKMNVTGADAQLG